LQPKAARSGQPAAWAVARRPAGPPAGWPATAAAAAAHPVRRRSLKRGGREPPPTSSSLVRYLSSSCPASLPVGAWRAARARARLRAARVGRDRCGTAPLGSRADAPGGRGLRACSPPASTQAARAQRTGSCAVAVGAAAAASASSQATTSHDLRRVLSIIDMCRSRRARSSAAVVDAALLASTVMLFGKNFGIAIAKERACSWHAAEGPFAGVHYPQIILWINITIHNALAAASEAAVPLLRQSQGCGQSGLCRTTGRLINTVK
jgi:hypothetical protein